MSTIEELQKEAESLNKRYMESEECGFWRFFWSLAMSTLNSSIQQNQVALNENTNVKKVNNCAFSVLLCRSLIP